MRSLSGIILVFGVAALDNDSARPPPYISRRGAARTRGVVIGASSVETRVVVLISELLHDSESSLFADVHERTDNDGNSNPRGWTRRNRC